MMNKKRRMSALLLVGLLAVVSALITSCAKKEGSKPKTTKESRPTKKARPGFKFYMTEEGWRITYPKSWTTVAGSRPEFMLEIKPDSKKMTSVLIHRLTKFKSKQSLRESIDEDLRELQSKKVPFKELKINGISAIKCTYRAEEDRQNLRKLKAWFKKGHYGLLIVCSAPEKDFDKYRDTFEQIIDSVRFLR